MINDSVTDYYYSNAGETGSVSEERKNAGNLSYRPMRVGDFIDLKMISGKMNIFALEDEKVFDGKRVLFSDYFEITELDHDPLKKFQLNAGNNFSIDNQFIGTNSTGYKYYFKGEGLSGKVITTDYYWNSKFGWEIKKSEEPLKNKEDFWTSVGEGIKKEYQLSSGNATIFMWYDDYEKLVINE